LAPATVVQITFLSQNWIDNDINTGRGHEKVDEQSLHVTLFYLLGSDPSIY